ncbi:MAG: ImmA/IrrE family metallo-endopeptidase [Candidatus Hydrogenedentes bacterium]|nr:ImmA/IrrE family metallo-endopeptidase [Candidatus Hydrogenedentota bacterium]
MPVVKPEILRWARKAAGLTLEQAVEKLRLGPARGVSAVDRLAAFEVESEAGADVPRPLLVKMAKKYRRPLLTFYMSAPPRQGDRGQDFRALPAGRLTTDDAALDALIRDVQARQSLVRAILEEEEEAVQLSFIGSKKTPDGVAAVLTSIRDTLQINLSEFRSQPSAKKAFDWLRAKAEGAGIFVLLKGDLGSHHTALSLENFRGFALADPVAPFVVINDHDSEAAWSFTLLHELAHLWLGQTGVSGQHAELDIERFCNDVAGELLLPGQEARQLSIEDTTDFETIEQTITQLARARNLSSSMVAYCLYRVRAFDQDLWRRLRDFFREKWLRNRELHRERVRDDEGGPDFYVIRGHRIGKGLLDFVGRMMDAGVLTTTKAGKVLGVKPKQVQPLLEAGSRKGVRPKA